ncbi:hypothetical protein G9272_01005 [Streptomyces asoensis]|uniref:Uncharacterized protein n=1 Tax=Streptomyces asoensis TaxID=249586 RepID=A0A6M4WMJ7_9ACTN|nr:hypothetical protein [Streptomyces asoensis]QJS99085.1 hypothetical protein G9272_01005 [Streptomyces asoensis]
MGRARTVCARCTAFIGSTTIRASSPLIAAPIDPAPTGLSSVTGHLHPHPLLRAVLVHCCDGWMVVWSPEAEQCRHRAA